MHFKASWRLPLFLPLFIVCAYGCFPYEDNSSYQVELNLDHDTTRKLYDYQDQRNVDSLIAYLDHQNATHRYRAVTAFATIRDDRAIEPLTKLLDDPVDRIRLAAIYSLGQSGSTQVVPSLIEHFDQMDTAQNHAKHNAAILEAIGKTGSVEELEQIVGVDSYRLSDTLLVLGQIRSILQFAQRGFIDDDSDNLMYGYLFDDVAAPEIQQLAAYYLATYSEEFSEAYVDELLRQFHQASNEDLQVYLIRLMTQNDADTLKRTLLNLTPPVPSERIRRAAVRAVSTGDYADVQANMLKLIRDDDLSVASLAAQYFVERGISTDAAFYWRLARDSLEGAVKYKLYEAANTHLPNYMIDTRNALNFELQRMFGAALDPFDKVAILRALGAFGWNYRIVHRLGFASNDPVVRVGTVDVLKNIAKRPDFRQFFGLSRRRVTAELAAYFREAIERGDAAMASVAAEALRTPERDFRSVLDSVGFISTAQNQLAIPKDLSTLNDLERTRAFLIGEPPSVPERPSYNHPIDWATVDRWTEIPQVIIDTDYGQVRVELYPELAPAAVLNFVQLIRSGSFEGRPVYTANDVQVEISAGRDVGYESQDYTLRSEFAQVDFMQSGWIGMIELYGYSSSSRFFITTEPAPHLDGKRTVLGRVTEGLNIVRQLNPGDRITKITIL